MEMRLKISRGKPKLCPNHSHRLHPQPDVLTTWHRSVAETAVHSSEHQAFPFCTELDLCSGLPWKKLPSSIFHPTEENEACCFHIPAIRCLHMHMLNPSLPPSQLPSLPASLSLSLFYLLPKCFCCCCSGDSLTTCKI